MNAEPLPIGLYERLVDEGLENLLKSAGPLKRSIRPLDEEESPALEAAQIGRLIEPVLRSLKADPVRREELLRKLVELLASTEDGNHLLGNRLIFQEGKSSLLEEVFASGLHATPSIRPATSLSASSLFTGAHGDPPLERELRYEMMSADRVDMLVAFIKWSGLRLLQPALEDLARRKVPVRIITTSYMGASDAEAVLWLARQPGFNVRVSYDTTRTRLHAKAYRFIRNTGYSTAYIGSANLSESAMTRGLEWAVKVTESDMPALMKRFEAEFETYWTSSDFSPLSDEMADDFKRALTRARGNLFPDAPRFFADIEPRAFQRTILEALENRRAAHERRALVVAATGTGKTVIAAFDYKAFCQQHNGPRPRLLFVAHRQEILLQARDCFRTVLRDQNFGDLLVAGYEPQSPDHLFASVQSLSTRRPWQNADASFFDYIVIDEAHHGAAPSYRPLFDEATPRFLLALTATPERMDGTSILSDFGNRATAEIRLPDALEARLLCPFHYFGVSDPVALTEERFWINGRYSTAALEQVYTGDDLRAKQRVDVIVSAVERYVGTQTDVRCVGFCVSVRHAHYMAESFRALGYSADVILGETPDDQRHSRMVNFRNGSLKFLFTVDVLSEGVDVPEINLVMFLRPTDSLTVFLQQLGRGLRHAPGKEIVTVLDFVGQNHRRYQIGRKFASLLSRQRFHMENEVEQDFPHLPAGCSIMLERQAREHVLNQIRENLRSFNEHMVENLKCFEAQHGAPLTFSNFVERTETSPEQILRRKTWSSWKAEAQRGPETKGDNKSITTLNRILARNDEALLRDIQAWARQALNEPSTPYHQNPERSKLIHFALHGKDASDALSLNDGALALATKPGFAQDTMEISEYARTRSLPWRDPEIGFACELSLHGSYSAEEIKAAFGLADIGSRGVTGVGVMHEPKRKVYIHLVTFDKSEKDFEPSTRYQDYPISPTLLHWQSQSNTSQESTTGQNYRHFIERGYTILFFARMTKRDEFNNSAPYTFLGSALRYTQFTGGRPITIVWELKHPIPAALFDAARRA